MDTQLKKGVLAMLVLVQLTENDMYGYELVKKIATTSNLDVSEGTIYPLLRRLKLEGHVDTYLQESNSGPSRKYYKITSSGTDYVNMRVNEWQKFSAKISNLLKKYNAKN